MLNISFIKYSLHYVVMHNPIHNILYWLLTYFRLYAYFRSTLHILLFLALFNISCIKYSMYDVIFVRVRQSLSMIFGKYQLQYTWFVGPTGVSPKMACRTIQLFLDSRPLASVHGWFSRIHQGAPICIMIDPSIPVIEIWITRDPSRTIVKLIL